MADPATKAVVGSILDALPDAAARQGDEIITNTYGIPRDLLEPELPPTKVDTQIQEFFDTPDDAREYVFNYVKNQPTPTTKGMPEIWVANTRRKAKPRKNMASVEEPSHIKLNIYDNLKHTDDIKRANEKIPVEDVKKTFALLGQPERADEYIAYVKEGNERVAQEVQARSSKEPGLWVRLSKGHLKSTKKGGITVPRNLRVEDYKINVTKQHKGDLPDPLLKALNVPFSWEEDILKFLNDDLSLFWADMTKKERDTLIKEVMALKKANPDEPVNDIVDDVLMDLGWSSRGSVISKMI